MIILHVKLASAAWVTNSSILSVINS